ncbi:MAG: response regulator, partial [Planctomycetota bacterium]
PFAVIVTDMTMPRENGAEFLERMLELSPDSVRIMLTGNADQATAAEAVNRGRVFRFLNKPCQADELEAAIEEGLAEHAARSAERDRVRLAEAGVPAALRAALAVAAPDAVATGDRVADVVGELVDAVDGDAAIDAEALRTAASLSQLGALSSDPAGDPHAVAADVIAAAPSLSAPAEWVAAASGDAVESPDEPVEAQLLRLAIAFEGLLSEGAGRADALHELTGDAARYGATALDALRAVVARHDARRLVEVGPDELRDGMQLVEDVATTAGAVLIAKGSDVTAGLRDRLRNYAASHELRLPLRALATADVADELQAVGA